MRKYGEDAYQTYIAESGTCDDLAIWMAPAGVKSSGARHRSFSKILATIIELDRACHRRAEDLAVNAGKAACRCCCTISLARAGASRI
jgi:hypothetical protein